MNFVKKPISSSLFLTTLPFLSMCSSYAPAPEEQRPVVDNSFEIKMEMSSDNVSKQVSEISFTNMGRYFLNYTWTDNDGKTSRVFPGDSLKFTVSAWDQNEEIYYERFYSYLNNETENGSLFLKVNKSKLNKPIKILVIGTIRPLPTSSHHGTLNVIIDTDKPN